MQDSRIKYKEFLPPTSLLYEREQRVTDRGCARSVVMPQALRLRSVTPCLKIHIFVLHANENCCKWLLD
jgi:hypothetical protein